jgi:hypothetical protein
VSRCDKCWDDQVVWVRTPAGASVEVACPACAGGVSGPPTVTAAIPLLATAAPTVCTPKAFEDLQVGDEIALRFKVNDVDRRGWIGVTSLACIGGDLTKNLYQEMAVDTELTRLRDRARVRRYVDEQPADGTKWVLVQELNCPDDDWVLTRPSYLAASNRSWLWCYLPDFIAPNAL